MDANERKRRLTRLRVQKHRVVKEEFCNDNNTKSSNESGTSDFTAPGREPSEEPPSPMNVSGDTNYSNNSAASFHSPPPEAEDSQHTDVNDSNTSAAPSDRSSVSNQNHNENISNSEDSAASDDHSSGEDIDVRHDGEVEEIRKWAVETNIACVHLDGLLTILRRRLLPQLPKSSKTFLGTLLAQYNIVEMEDLGGESGEFVYLGIEKGLRNCMNKNLHRTDSTLQLQFNIDGMSIADSSFSQVWPILCRVFHAQDVYKPFPVAIYYGQSKPKYMEDYLEQFVEEMNRLACEGIVIDGKRFRVCIHSFICDTPARSMLKKVKGHTGFYACERCNVRGFKLVRTTVFPDVDAEERTDQTFRRRQHPEHHSNDGPTPLLLLEPPIDMVKLFILDNMHLFFPGVMKKLLLYSVTGSLPVLLPLDQRLRLSRRLEYLKSFVPCEFQRKPRAVKYLSKWKATELRFFLLYCGPIVFKGIIKENLYKHFLLLHAACRILCSSELAVKRNAYAKMNLKSFFLKMPRLYTRESQVMNVHNLIHVADDALNMQCDLSRISAFPFENALGTVIKKCIRTKNRPLAQICRRIHEQQIARKKVVLPPEVEILKWGRLITLDRRLILQCRIRGSFTIATKAPDNKVLLKTGDILRINEMHCEANDVNYVTIAGSVWDRKSSIFVYPCDSRHLKMWELETIPSPRILRCDVRQIENKMIMLPLPLTKSVNGRSFRYDRRFIMPLLHCW